MNTQFAPLEIVELDSPFFFGIARKMTPEEKEEAVAHGVMDDRPMSIIGVTREGLAGVDGREWADLIVAAPNLLKLCQAFRIAATFEGLESNAAWRDLIAEAREIEAAASGQNH